MPPGRRVKTAIPTVNLGATNAGKGGNQGGDHGKRISEVTNPKLNAAEIETISDKVINPAEFQQNSAELVIRETNSDREGSKMSSQVQRSTPVKE